MEKRPFGRRRLNGTQSHSTVPYGGYNKIDHRSPTAETGVNEQENPNMISSHDGSSVAEQGQNQHSFVVVVAVIVALGTCC